MPYGYMRLVQLHAYSRLGWNREGGHTYCETGVNGGHGTAAMLLANPQLVAHSFDEGIQPYSREVFDMLKLQPTLDDTTDLHAHAYDGRESSAGYAATGAAAPPATSGTPMSASPPSRATTRRLAPRRTTR